MAHGCWLAACRLAIRDNMIRKGRPTAHWDRRYQIGLLGRPGSYPHWPGARPHNLPRCSIHVQGRHMGCVEWMLNGRKVHEGERQGDLAEAILICDDATLPTPPAGQAERRFGREDLPRPYKRCDSLVL